MLQGRKVRVWRWKVRPRQSISAPALCAPDAPPSPSPRGCSKEGRSACGDGRSDIVAQDKEALSINPSSRTARRPLPPPPPGPTSGTRRTTKSEDKEALSQAAPAAGTGNLSISATRSCNARPSPRPLCAPTPSPPPPLLLIPSLPPNPRRKSRFRDAPTPDSPHGRATSISPISAVHSRHRCHTSASFAPAFAADGSSDGVARLNSFLRRQRAVVIVLAAGDRTASRPTKLVLSDASKSVSSIVAAICYAWMLPSKGDGQAAVPVVNMPQSRMAWCRQAAWLLYHVGVDASALLFTDEVDMDGLIMDQRVSLLVVGQDVLKSKAEVASVCTTLTHTYCEDAYSLLQNLDIKKLLADPSTDKAFALREALAWHRRIVVDL
uniref:Uncharacterized protein n=1 Tax=Zea mays TaxID=4577 RepID=A0A804UK41_MAIZE